MFRELQQEHVWYWPTCNKECKHVGAIFQIPSFDCILREDASHLKYTTVEEQSHNIPNTQNKSVRYIDWDVKQEPLKSKNGQQHPTIALEQQASSTSSTANLKWMLMPDLILHLTKIVPSNSLPIHIVTMSL